MKSTHRNIIKSKAEYTRSYKGLRGVCYTADNEDAFSELENMYVDYSAGGDAVESVPGYRSVINLSGKIYGIYPQRLGTGEEYLIVHAGSSLYRFNVADRDTLASATLISEIADSPSVAKCFNDNMFILAGSTIYLVSESGSVSTLSSSSNSTAYEPTLFRNGVPYEDKNMLTHTFKEIYEPRDVTDVIRGTPQLVYGNFNSADMTCAVVGINAGYANTVHVPSKFTLNGSTYRVTAIAPGALSMCADMTTLITNPGLESIGKYAVGSCEYLETVKLSSTVRTVSDDAFACCPSLKTVYFGASLAEVGDGIFRESNGVTDIHYALDESALARISGYDQLLKSSVSYHSVSSAVHLAIPISSPIDAIYYLRVNGKSMTYEADLPNKFIYLTFSDIGATKDLSVLINGRFNTQKIEIDGREPEFSCSVNNAVALLSCTVCEEFDGRLFLTGSPYAKGAVFCCTRTVGGEYSPLYFSVRDYFVDGSGSYGNTALLATQGALAVCKSGDNESGTVYFHTVKEEDGTRSYPVSYVQNNLRITGPAYNFNGEALFVTDKGIFTLKGVSGADYRKPVCRTEAINPRVCGILGSDTHFCEWEGYLVVQTGASVYLADPKSRRGEGEGYDWYPLTDIGIWNNDRKTYRYSTCPRDGYHLHPDSDEITTAPIQLDVVGTERVYYMIDSAARKKYLLYHAGERFAGSFVPACSVASCSGLLFFGSEDGKICVFNSDKRGVAPDEIAAMADFDAEEYAAEMYNKIHPLYYSRLGHSVRFLATTPDDDCGIPYLEKLTVRDSEVAVLKCFRRGSLNCVRVTDTSGAQDAGLIGMSAFGFEDLDFRAISFDPSETASLKCADGDSGWRRKRIALYSDEFYRPFGVYSVSYRYKIKGKLKER